MALSLGFLVLLIVLAVCGYYAGSVVTLHNRINKMKNKVSAKTKRYSDLCARFADSIKLELRTEKDAIEILVKTRDKINKTTDVNEQLKIINYIKPHAHKLTSVAKIVKKLETAAKQFEIQIEEAEQTLNYNISSHNKAVERFNNLISTTPGNWFAKLLGKKEQIGYF